jgi:hypothetical protein
VVFTKSLEFVRQFGARIATDRMGLAEEVGKVFIGLGPCGHLAWSPSRRTFHQGKEPIAHQLHAVGAVGLVVWQSRHLLPKAGTHAPEGEDDEDDCTDDPNPQENAIAAR